MSSYTFKVVLLGEGSVGKTSLVLRYVSNVFNESHQSTLQASFLQKQLYLERDLVKLKIWDTAGQEKFHALVPIYYREANGALLVYDVTSSSSLSRVRNWVKELNRMLGIENVELAIVGNKTDLLTYSNTMESSETSAIIQEALEFTNELLNAEHYLTSAKLSQGVNEVFLSLSERMVERSRKRRFAINDGIARLPKSLSLGEGDDIFRVDQRIDAESGRNSNKNKDSCCWK